MEINEKTLNAFITKIKKNIIEGRAGANIDKMIVKLYKLGVSERGIATLLDIGKSTVRRHLGALGYKSTPYSGITICMHHINGDPQDNRLENLKLITSSKHTQEHSRKCCPNGFAWCSGCQDCLPKESFGKHRTRWNGLSIYCKICRSKMDYAKRQHSNVKERERSKRWRIKNKEDCHFLDILLKHLEA